MLRRDTDRSNSVEVGELLSGLASAFPGIGWNESIARLLVRSFDTNFPQKNSLNFAEFQNLFLQIQATQRYMRASVRARTLFLSVLTPPHTPSPSCRAKGGGALVHGPNR